MPATKNNSSKLQDDYTTHPVGTYVDRTMKLIRSKYLSAFKKANADITTEQWTILDKLHESDGLSQTDLASGTFKNTATVSRIIDLLETKSLIERRRLGHDRRTYNIYLTNSGKGLVKKLHPVVFELRRQGWKDISEKEHEIFLKLINKIYGNFEKCEI